MKFSSLIPVILVSMCTVSLTTACGQKEAAQQAERVPGPTAAAEALVKRMTPQFADKVIFRLDAQNSTPTITGNGGKICITAANQRECIRAYGFYLRNIAHVHFSWNGDNSSGAQFVIPTTCVKVPAALPFNYAYNYCTLSYSGAHWDKARWER